MRPDPSAVHARPAGVRIGDRERAEAADRLADHAAAGRLTVEELEERLERAHAAVVAADLRALEADLPSPVPVRGDRRAMRPPPLLALALACVAATVLLSVAVGHPVPPLLFLAAVLLLRAGGWPRRVVSR